MTALGGRIGGRLVRLSPPAAAPRLLCLPHAGGRGDAYRPWIADADGALELWTSDLPGRHTRAAEPLVLDPREVVAALAADAATLLDRPLAVLGHSMGALLAFELVYELERRGGAPAALVVSGCPAPSVRAPAGGREPGPDASDAALVALLRRWGGTPEELLGDRDFLAAVLPPLRADLALIARHRPSAGRVRAPLLALAGEQDDVAPPDAMRPWAACSARWRGLRVLPGGHFFLHERRADALDAVAAAFGGG